MISIDEALNQYELLLCNYAIDSEEHLKDAIDYFKTVLNNEDYNIFLNLAPFIYSVWYVTSSGKYKEMFAAARKCRRNILRMVSKEGQLPTT
jgi:superfamily I DNA/RNA helicase